MIKERITEFQKNVRSKIVMGLVGAFALVIALSWNEAIKSGIDDLLSYFNVSGTTFYYKLIVAVLTTVICVAGIMYFSRWGEVEKK